MKKLPILIVTAVLSIPTFALMLLAVFETMTAPFYIVPYFLIRRVWLLIALSSPMVVAYDALREKFGVSLKGFLLTVCVTPIAATIIYGAVLLCIGVVVGGWSGLLALNYALGTGLAVMFTATSVAIWTVVYHNIELIKSEKAKKAIAIVCLVLCAAAVGASLREMTELRLLSVVISRYKQYSLVEEILPILPVIVFAGLAAAGILIFYRGKYGLKPPIFVLCAFLPGLLITGLRTVLEKGDSQKFHTQIENLVALAAAMAFSVMFYAVIRAIQAKKHRGY